jgi:hypothetical protein
VIGALLDNSRPLLVALTIAPNRGASNTVASPSSPTSGSFVGFAQWLRNLLAQLHHQLTSALNATEIGMQRLLLHYYYKLFPD